MTATTEGWPGVSAPHAWGWAKGITVYVDGSRISPTRVGMGRLSKTLSQLPARQPHASGDGPLSNSHGRVDTESAPHEWGWAVAASPMRSASANQPHTRGDESWLRQVG